MDYKRDDQSLNGIVIRKIQSEKEIVEAMQMRLDVLKVLPAYKNVNLEDYYEVEIEGALNIYRNGIAYAAFNEQQQLISFALTFDLTFEPISNLQKQFFDDGIVSFIRNDARKILNPKPGQYSYIGYGATRKDYRNLHLTSRIGLMLLKENYSQGFKYIVAIASSKQGYEIGRSFGGKIINQYNFNGDAAKIQILEKQQTFYNQNEKMKEKVITKFLLMSEFKKIEPLINFGKL
ncbi:UNKNOWN [Stylonychia lemnae]|uniref:N-acetyltransferase domain-containing protein n=1 Tax=Stylonychia lemnae TaxID=5949 RepID=A0A078B9R2_STYLE|nr:UNKNOWN [Stylonychia lemnae]|eukprot:CDW89992.1 UNKNOWN [Stylonychia lemnae]